jgi:hypothetical protein
VADPAWADPALADPAWADPTLADPAWADPALADPTWPIPLWPIPLRRRCTQLLRRMSVSCVNTEVVLELVSQLRACTAKHAPLFEFLKVGGWALNGQLWAKLSSALPQYSH